MDEIWKPTEGFPGYDVSNYGRVRSYYMRGPKTRIADSPHRILKPRTTRKGYHRICLRRDGSRASVYVHKLVTTAFLGPRPAGLQVNHRNGNKADNYIGNLEYVTPRENTHHARDVLGTLSPLPVRRGEAQHNSKLTEKDVLEIRSRYAAGGVLQRELAQEFGVGCPCICEVISGKAWKHVGIHSQRQTESK